MKMIFDIESNGLMGEGFAVGWVVVNDKGDRVSEGFQYAKPTGPIDPWVVENVIPKLGNPTQPTVKAVRDVFWDAWLSAKASGATLWADCNWPVESRFLLDCINDDPATRTWQGPYPLHEMATALLMKGLDSTAHYNRLEDEPAHHPLGDARQSARILMDLLK